VEQTSATLGVDTGFLRKVGGAESGFRNVDNASGPGGAPTSSATGPFQITEGTFDGLARRYPQYGLNNRRDPAQQAIAAPLYAREVADFIASKTGRTPDDGEKHLGWFLGPQDAAKVITADPGAPIRMVVSPRSIAANPGVFGSITTVGEMLAWSARKMGATASPSGTVKYGAGPQFPEGKARFADAVPADPYTDLELSAQAKRRGDEAFSITRGAIEAMRQESALRWAFENEGAQAPDPAFKVTSALLKERAADVPDRFVSYLGEAHSAENFDWRLGQLRRDLETDRRLDAMGLKGTALRIGVSIVDPAGWLVTAGLAPVGGALRLGRLGRIAAGAVEGAAGNLVAEVPMALNKPTWEADSLVYAGAGGLIFGSAFGALGRSNPAVAREMGEMQTAAKALMTHQEQRYAPVSSGESTAGAMATPGRVDPVRGDVSDFLDRNFRDAWDVGAFSRVRFDTTGRLKASENPLVRALGNLLGEETVSQADKGKATFRAITEDQTILQRRYDIAWSRDYRAAWADYRSRNEVGWFAGMNGEETRFRQLVTAYVRNTDGTVEWDPAVSRMGETWKRLNGEYLKLAQGDHRALDGTMRPPLRGFENVDPSAAYVPRIVHWERWNALHTEFGTREMERLVSSAIRGMNPDMEAELAEKIGRGYVKRLHTVSAGQQLSTSRMFSSLDVEQMRASLRDAGLMDDEVEAALYRATARDGAKAANARGKPRQLLDENFRMDLTGKAGSREVAIAELFHDDAQLLFTLYNRQMSGTVAMSRLRVENPRWRPGEDDIHPRYLVDGIHGASDWETLVKRVRAVAADPEASPKARESVDADVSRLQFMFNGITGIPSDFDRTKLAQAVRLVRDYNFVRVMNQVGFAQVAEIGMITGGLGLRTAISAMPSLRSLLRDARTGHLKDELAHELEWISTAGTDTLRGIGHVVTDDFGSPVTHLGRSPRMVQAEGLLQRGARVTTQISGMAAINAYLQRWAAKGVLYKFVDMSAEGASVNRQRMRVLGLPDDMQERIFAELRTKPSFVEGERTGSRLQRLNLEDWDPETRGAFEHAIFRWTRKVIQENDLGQTNTVLGSSLGKLFFQFRSFMLGAWTKNTLHNAHMRDWESLSMLIGTMTFGGLAYAAQTHLQSLGREDREKFLEKRLEPRKLAAAAFQRAGFSSLLPGAWDNAMFLGGMDPLFDTRVTGTPSQGLTSFAATALLDSGMKGVRGVAGSLTGDPYSQRDFRALVSALPFGNALPMSWLANALASGLPEKDAPRARH